MANEVPAVPFDPRLDLIRDAIPADKPDWTENIAWSFFDPQADVALYGHLGRMQPDRRIWEGLSLIFLPNGQFFANRSLGVNLSAARNAEYDYRPVIPGKLWRYEFNGTAQRVDPAELRRRPLTDAPFEVASYDLTFEALQPVFNMHRSTLASDRMHLEHAGRVHGSVVIGGQRFEIDATGYRDHSMSQRTFTTLDSETWANCAFPSGRIFSILEVRRGERQILEGQVFIDGVTHHAKPLDVPALEDSAGAPHIGKLRIASDAGENVIAWGTLEGRSMAFQLLRPVGMRPGLDWSRTDNVAAIQCPAEFTWNGEVGYGWLERTRPLHSLRD